jgi:hypothetical protein
MGLKVLARFAVLLAVALAPAVVFAQSEGQSAVNRPATDRRTSAVSTSSNAAPKEESSTTPGDVSSAPGADGDGSVRDSHPPTHITVTDPAPEVKPWIWQERVTWGANILLAAFGFWGIWTANALLRKIDRQIAFAESAAEAAGASAHAAMLNAQAFIRSERPWILITIEPSRSLENSFTVMATNRGRTPARITATVDRTRIAVDENRLPSFPEYTREVPEAPLVPIILVPGESTAIKSFCRDEVKALCDSEERYKRIETWEEKVFLHGKVTYMDLISPSDDEFHETNWCCWYIHGRQNSGLVIAGPPEYNSHT